MAETETVQGGSAPVRWGVLATGAMAAAFTEDLRQLPDAEVVAVGSRTAASARRFAGRFGIPRAHGSWAEFAADDQVDVVYVAAPHSEHLRAAGMCLEAGRAVLCEKPLALSARQAGELVALARERDVFLMEGMWMWCNPLVRRLAALVADGAVGEVRTVAADFGLPGPFPPGHRLLDPARGGGALLDLGVYPVAFAQLLLGEPERVTARATLSAEGVDTHTSLLLEWAGGAQGLLHCSVTADTPRAASVSGTGGWIEVPGSFFRPDHFVLHRPGSEPEVFRSAGGPDDTWAPQAAEVMRCLRAGERQSPLVPLEATLGVLRTVDAARAEVGVGYPGE
ncbi:Gfo/Idh/MocA family protein [Streptomyces albidoflavus]